MKSVIEIEQELAQAKKIELYRKWELYLDRVKNFAESLKDKAIIKHISNGSFILYKVLGWKENYYMDIDGAFGQFSPKRWLELETTGYVNCHVADDKGNWYRFSGRTQHEGTSYFKAIIEKRKPKKSLEISKIDFNNQEVSEACLVDISHSVKIGFTEYKEYSQEPSYDRAMGQFLLFTQIAPEGMFESAKAIADDNLNKTKSFWEEFQPKCKDLKPLYETNPL